MSDAVVPGAAAPVPGAEGQDQQQQQGGGQPRGSSAPGGAENLGEIAKEAVRRLKYKTSDGREEEVDEAEALKVYMNRKQHQAAASRIFNEGKAARAQAEKVAEMLNSEDGIEEVLKKLGKDPRALAEKILGRHLENEMMDPRDRELRDAKARLKQIEDMETKQKEAVAQKRLDEVKSKFMKEYETEFVKALSETNLPPTKAMVAEMAKYISRSAKIGFKMSAGEAAQLVREDIQNAHKRLIGDADGDTLIKLLGDDVANKIRKYDTSKVKDPNAFLRTPEQPGEHRERSTQKSKRMTTREWQLHKRGLK